MELQRLSQVGPHLNAYTFGFADTALDEVRRLYRDSVAAAMEAPENQHLFAGGRRIGGVLEHERGSFFVLSYREAPLLWVSANDAATYAVFKRAFEALDIADDVKQLVDYKSDITVYGGFYVVGRQLPEEAWHVDYRPGANAYTLLTPLFEIAPGQGNLLYRDAAGEATTYTYRLGEGIIVGEHFSHTTEPYDESGSLRVLLSLTFGTDMLQYWSILGETVGTQSTYVILPCGHERSDCSCVQ